MRGLELFREKREYLKVRKNEGKRQKVSFNNSNLGPPPAKVINLPRAILTKRVLKNKGFWAKHGWRFSNLQKLYLDKRLFRYIFEGLNIGF